MLSADDLRSVKLFEDLADSELRQLTKELREVSYSAGSEIVIRGQRGVGFMVILNGEAEVATVDGRRRALGRGEQFGKMALLDHEGRSADITAKTDVRLAGVPAWGFKRVLRRHPEPAS